MPRRGRAASPPRASASRAPMRTASPPPSASRSNLPARAPPQQMSPASGMAQPKQPSMFAQMASTAAGVAVGSTVGHVAGAAITGSMGGGGGSGSSSNEVQQQSQSSYPVANGQMHQEGQQGGACSLEIQRFVECAQQQTDLTWCDGFNEAVRECKRQQSYGGF